MAAKTKHNFRVDNPNGDSFGCTTFDEANSVLDDNGTITVLEDASIDLDKSNVRLNPGPGPNYHSLKMPWYKVNNNLYAFENPVSGVWLRIERAGSTLGYYPDVPQDKRYGDGWLLLSSSLHNSDVKFVGHFDTVTQAKSAAKAKFGWSDDPVLFGASVFDKKQNPPATSIWTQEGFYGFIDAQGKKHRTYGRIAEEAINNTGLNSNQLPARVLFPKGRGEFWLGRDGKIYRSESAAKQSKQSKQSKSGRSKSGQLDFFKKNPSPEERAVMGSSKKFKTSLRKAGVPDNYESVLKYLLGQGLPKDVAHQYALFATDNFGPDNVERNPCEGCGRAGHRKNPCDGCGGDCSGCSCEGCGSCETANPKKANLAKTTNAGRITRRDMLLEQRGKLRAGVNDVWIQKVDRELAKERGNPKKYPFYVVADGLIIGGWEYREDAKEQADEYAESGLTSKILTAVGAKRKGITKWASHSNLMQMLAKTRNPAWSITEELEEFGTDPDWDIVDSAFAERDDWDEDEHKEDEDEDFELIENPRWAGDMWGKRHERHFPIDSERGKEIDPYGSYASGYIESPDEIKYSPSNNILVRVGEYWADVHP
ncbi:MAG: hypothetical protein HN929_11575, partial [Chloroflexi bacterium]|nr:hypothetical protein [Chloroflexota bacterium]